MLGLWLLISYIWQFETSLFWKIGDFLFSDYFFIGKNNYTLTTSSFLFQETGVFQWARLEPQRGSAIHDPGEGGGQFPAHVGPVQRPVFARGAEKVGKGLWGRTGSEEWGWHHRQKRRLGFEPIQGVFEGTSTSTASHFPSNKQS